MHRFLRLHRLFIASLRIPFFFNIVNVTSLRFNKLCLHPYHREHHYCSEKFKARQEFSVLTWVNDQAVSNERSALTGSEWGGGRREGLGGAGGGVVKRGKLVRATLT